MKNLILLLSVILFASCDKQTDEPTPKSFKIDPTAVVYIKAAPVTTKAATAGHLTPLEIVKRATTMRFSNLVLAPNGSDCAGPVGMGRDTISATPAFIRYGTDIINEDGFGKPYLVPDFIYAYDCVIEIFRSNHDIDTIAYIPNSCFREAETKIKAALEAKDTTAVYGIFNNAFRFIPITGAEYRQLKKQGLQ